MELFDVHELLRHQNGWVLQQLNEAMRREMEARYDSGLGYTPPPNIMLRMNGRLELGRMSVNKYIYFVFKNVLMGEVGRKEKKMLYGIHRH